MKIVNSKSFALAALFLACLANVAVATEGDVMPLDVDGEVAEPATMASIHGKPKKKGKKGKKPVSQASVAEGATTVVEDPSVLIADGGSAGERVSSSSSAGERVSSSSSAGAAASASSSKPHVEEISSGPKGKPAAKAESKVVISAADLNKCVPNRFEKGDEQGAKCCAVLKQARASQALSEDAPTVPAMLALLEKADPQDERTATMLRVASILYGDEVAKGTADIVSEENAAGLCDAAQAILKRFVNNQPFARSDETLFTELKWPLPSRFATEVFVDTAKGGDKESLDYVEAFGMKEVKDAPSRRWFHLGTGHFGPVKTPEDNVAIYIEDIIVESLYWFKNLGWTNAAEEKSLNPEFVATVERVAKSNDVAFYRFLMYVAQCRSVPITDGMVSRVDDITPERTALRNQLVTNLLALVRDRSDPMRLVLLENMLRAAPLKNVEAIYYFARGLLLPIVEASSKSAVVTAAEGAPKAMSASAKKNAKRRAAEKAKKGGQAEKESQAEKEKPQDGDQVAKEKPQDGDQAKEKPQEGSNGVIVAKSRRPPKPEPTPEELEEQRKKRAHQEEIDRLHREQRQKELDRQIAEEARKKREEELARKGPAREERKLRKKGELPPVEIPKTPHVTPPKDRSYLTSSKSSVLPKPAKNKGGKKPAPKSNGSSKTSLPKPGVIVSKPRKGAGSEYLPLGPVPSGPKPSSRPKAAGEGSSSASAASKPHAEDMQERESPSPEGPALLAPEALKPLHEPKQEPAAVPQPPQKPKKQPAPSSKKPVKMHVDVLAQRLGEMSSEPAQPQPDVPTIIELPPGADLGFADAMDDIERELEEGDEEGQDDEDDELVPESRDN